MATRSESPTPESVSIAEQSVATVSSSAFAGIPRVPAPVNDPNKAYLPGSPERAELKARLAQMAAERVEIPLVIGGKRIRTGRVAQAVMPHDHQHVLADWHLAGPEHVHQAIAA